MNMQYNIDNRDYDLILYLFVKQEILKEEINSKDLENYNNLYKIKER